MVLAAHEGEGLAECVLEMIHAAIVPAELCPHRRPWDEGGLARIDAVEPLRSGAFISAEAASVAASWAVETEAQRYAAACARVAA